MKRDHKRESIANWKKYGIISEDYDSLYNYHISITNCELCNVKFTDEIKYQRCMDHDHNTGLYRKTLCRSCNSQYLKAPQRLKANNKTRHMWVSLSKAKQRSGNYSFGWRYQRKIGDVWKRKSFNTLTKAIAFSFIQIIKNPI